MSKKEMKTQEGKEDMMIGEVILAMGADVEDAARRPCVMGGPLQATPWPGSPQRIRTHQKASGQTQMKNSFIKDRLPPGKYKRRENPGGDSPDLLD